tara:strand:+ start:220 stop:384 length:165 start_codon:yes stop_codon:yes gene_type:complete
MDYSMKKDKKRMGMMYGSMARKKKMGGGMTENKKRNAMNAGGMVAAAMEVQKAN